MTDTKKIKTTIEDLLKLLQVTFESVEEEPNPSTGSPKFTIKTSDSALLIGTRGVHLLAFNHVVKKIVGKDFPEEEGIHFFIDVNNYQEKVEDELKAKAKVMADRARSFKVDIELDPMSSYERMVVHSVLQDMKDIKTESKGEGRMRRVVIKYVDPSSNSIE